MHTAVFDTNILIHFSRGHEGAQAIIRKVEYRLISIVTWVEFLTGIPYPQQDKAKAFLSDMFEIVETPRAVYEDALDIRRAHRMKLPDALIYATARACRQAGWRRDPRADAECLPRGSKIRARQEGRYC